MILYVLLFPLAADIALILGTSIPGTIFVLIIIAMTVGICVRARHRHRAVIVAQSTRPVIFTPYVVSVSRVTVSASTYEPMQEFPPPPPPYTQEA